jgi:hypothetical protein
LALFFYLPAPGPLDSLILRPKHLVLWDRSGLTTGCSAASETRFFLRTDETEIEFQKDGFGNVVEMVVHPKDSSLFRCARVENSRPQ